MSSNLGVLSWSAVCSVELKLLLHVQCMQHQSYNKRSSIFITSSMKGPTICTGVGNIKREKIKSKEYLFRKVMQK